MSTRNESQPSSKTQDYVQPMLVSRRTCLAVAGGVLVIPEVALGAPALAEGRSFDLAYVLTDRRLPQSLEFGRALSARGAKPLEVTSGLTAIWQRVLVPLWETPGRAVAGLTSRGVWECVAEQARSQGRRSMLVGFHGLDAESGLAGHWLAAPPQLMRSAESLEGAGEAWPLTMAALAGRCEIGARACAGEWRSNSAQANSPPPTSLVSWMIG